MIFQKRQNLISTELDEKGEQEKVEKQFLFCSPEEMYLLRDIDRLVVPEDRMKLWNTIAMPQLLKNVKIGDINHISFGRLDAGGVRHQYVGSYARVEDEKFNTYFVCGIHKIL